MKKAFLIGISGGTGSGKSFVSNKIREKINFAESMIFTLDNYYISRDLIPKDENGERNFDLPESLDLNKYAEDLQKLVNGNQIEQKVYFFNKAGMPDQFIKIDCKEIIIVEGLFTFHHPEIENLFDYKIFINTSIEKQYQRRVKRDLEERGYDQADVDYKFANHIKPSYQKYIQPIVNTVDYILENSLDENLDNEIDNLIKILNEKFNRIV